MPRLSFPRIDAIKALFATKPQWSLKDLAAKANVAPSTIEGVLAGRGVFKSTVKSIADAFGVDYRTLLASNDVEAISTPSSCEATNVPVTGLRITLHIDIDGNSLDDFELCNLLNSVKKAIGAKGDIDPVSVRKGSVLADVDMERNDFPKLLFAFADGKLRSYDLAAIIVPRESAPYVLKLLKDACLADIPASLLAIIAIGAVIVDPFFLGALVTPLITAALSKYGRNAFPLIVTEFDNGSIRISRKPHLRRGSDDSAPIAPIAPTDSGDGTRPSGSKSRHKQTSHDKVRSPSNAQ